MECLVKPLLGLRLDVCLDKLLGRLLDCGRVGVLCYQGKQIGLLFVNLDMQTGSVVGSEIEGNQDSQIGLVKRRLKECSRQVKLVTILE